MTELKPEDRIITVLEEIRLRLVQTICAIDRGKEYLEKCKKKVKMRKC